MLRTFCASGRCPGSLDKATIRSAAVRAVVAFFCFAAAIASICNLSHGSPTPGRRRGDRTGAVSLALRRWDVHELRRRAARAHGAWRVADGPGRRGLSGLRMGLLLLERLLFSERLLECLPI